MQFIDHFYGGKKNEYILDEANVEGQDDNKTPDGSEKFSSEDEDDRAFIDDEPISSESEKSDDGNRLSIGQTIKQITSLLTTLASKFNKKKKKKRSLKRLNRFKNVKKRKVKKNTISSDEEEKEEKNIQIINKEIVEDKACCSKEESTKIIDCCKDDIDIVVDTSFIK